MLKKSVCEPLVPYLITYSKILSTQTKAKQLINTEVSEGTVILAKEQTGGYGRYKRLWHSPVGGLWFSVILFPRCDPKKVSLFAAAASVAIARSLEKLYRIKPSLKWPNDVIIDEKKVAGILIDASIIHNKTEWSVVGIGVNTNNAIPKQIKNEAISLKKYLGKKVENNILLNAIISEFHGWYKKLLKGQTQKLLQEYKKRLALKNKRIIVTSGKLSFEGLISRVDSYGNLILRGEDGKIKSFSSGSVCLAGKNKGK